MTDAELMQRVNANINSLMEKYSYTRKDMAEIIGISYSSFCNKIARNNGKFNLYELQKIAEEFYITIDELIKGGFEK